jgi:pyruvate dehydrogenase E2 component (dihydrolipoamide acetyltransferase)
MSKEVILERPKDGVDAVEVNALKVAVGDVVTKGQALLEVQADKAQLEVMAPLAGRIAKLLVKEGDEIKVGQVYCLIDSENGAASPAPSRPAAPPEKPAPKVEAAKPKAAEAAPAANHVEEKAPPVAKPEPTPEAGKVVAAGPATRRLARELGVDLTQVTGSARAGRVTEEDVKAFVRQVTSGSGQVQTATAGAGVTAPPLPRFEEFGPVDRQKLSMIRKATSRQMSLSWNLIPHVTQQDEADITDLEAFRKQQNAAGQKLTVTAFALKAVAVVLKRFETFNASLDSASGQLVLKRYYHVGVAVDTPTGLVVPVLRDVDRKSVLQLAGELTAVAERARLGKLDSKDLSGGTFTITNLGGIGGTGFTPIVNWPEVAILGMSRSRLLPVVRNGSVTPRLMLPLSLSYDHRVIDGAAAARFTRQLADLLENPLLLALHA